MPSYCAKAVTSRRLIPTCSSARMRATPVSAGALDDRHLDAMSGHPLSHRLTVTLESAEPGQFDTRLAALFFQKMTEAVISA